MEHRRLIIEKCSNPEENPNPAMPELPLDDNASRHRILIEQAAYEYVHQPQRGAKSITIEAWKGVAASEDAWSVPSEKNIIS